MINEITNNSTKSIPEFYSGQSILLTGATGFLGKVFIEKVLRCCPDVREIFLLMRSKKNLNIEERLEKILNLPLFEKLREEQPLNFKKLIPVSGDVTKEELGLSAADRQVLSERVTIIIHAAASVRFNESLRYSVFVNIRSTRDICILAQSMKNLIALVHVSTAFVHTDNAVVEEKIYPPVVDWRKMIETAESLDEYTLSIFAAKYLNNSPNTYIFAKKLAESVIQEYSSSLPCAIVRPSVVIHSVNDPIPGWLDNLYGPIGMFIGGGKGILRVVYHNKNTSLDMVPVDFVIKTTLAIPWKFGLTAFTPGSAPFVVNCTNSDQRNMSIYENIKQAFILVKDVPLDGIVWTPHTTVTDNSIIYYILTMLLHILPAMLIDFILKFSGRQPMLMKLLRRLYVANYTLKHYMTNQWKFNNANHLALMSLISPDHQEMFSFDLSNLDIKECFKYGIIGAKTFLLNEDMNQLDASKAHRKRVVLIVSTLKTIIVIGILWMIYK